MATQWKREKDLQGWFTRWISQGCRGLGLRGGAGGNECPIGGAAFELKLLRGKRLRFSQIAPHQWEALRRVEGEEGLTYKISDSAIGWKPFDCFYIALGYSGLVIGVCDTKEVYIVDPGALYEVKEKMGGRGSVDLGWIRENGKRIN